MRAPHLLYAFALGLTATAAASCSSSPSVCMGAACGPDADGGTSGTSGTSGSTDSEAGGPTVAPPPGCDPTADAKDAPLCVDDNYAIFVDSTSGDDAAAGTKASPVRSIGVALGKLGGRPRVYVCEGTYAEQVKVASAVSLFGGFACGSWTYTGTKSKLAPSAKGYALQISGANGAVFSDLDITALDATEPSESSIAIFVASSTLTLRRLSVTAGRGISGSSRQQESQLPANGLKGGAAMNPTGGKGATNVCPDGNSTGGTGANTSAIGATAGTPDLGAGKGGVSGTLDCATGGFGGAGNNGTPGQHAPANESLGVLSALGWTPSAGEKGKAGTLGQGGGGGGSSSEAAGGGGGAGGCGGSGGAGGGGGGASVALAIFQADLLVTDSSLSSSAGGDGGAGALGQKGQSFGSGGDQGSGPTQSGCAGGRGGLGGDGGGGAGGAGGVSAAILFTGMAPEVDLASTVLTNGKAGAAGPGAAGNAGSEGKSDKIVEIL